MTKVEEVARALCARHYAERLGKSVDDSHVLMNVDVNWPMFDGDARTAIAAMREPNDTMVSAAIKREVAWEYGERGDPDAGPHVSSHASYLAMIDAALNEPSQSDK